MNVRFIGAFSAIQGGRSTTPEGATPAADAANVKKNYENKESWTPGAGTPPEETETPSEAAQAQATPQATNQEQPSREHSRDAKTGQAAATRSDGRSPGDTGTRSTDSANQPNTRDHPKRRTTAAAEGNGAGTEEGEPTTRQRYEKARDKAGRPPPKKAAPTAKKAAPTAKKNTPQHTENQRESTPPTAIPPSRERQTPTPQRRAGKGAPTTEGARAERQRAGTRATERREEPGSTPRTDKRHQQPPYKSNKKRAEAWRAGIFRGFVRQGGRNLAAGHKCAAGLIIIFAIGTVSKYICLTGTNVYKPQREKITNFA